DVDLAEKGSHALDLAPVEVVATDSGRVCVSGAKGTSKVVVLLDSAKAFRQLYHGTQGEATALALSGDQSVIYLAPRGKAGGTTAGVLGCGDRRRFPFLSRYGQGRLRGPREYLPATGTWGCGPGQLSRLEAIEPFGTPIFRSESLLEEPSTALLDLWVLTARG